MSLAHFLHRLCWQGRITTGFVNISRHMGQISCFSKLSMLFIFQGIIQEEAENHSRKLRSNLRRLMLRWSDPGERPVALVLVGAVSFSPAGVTSVFSSQSAVTSKVAIFALTIFETEPGSTEQLPSNQLSPLLSEVAACFCNMFNALCLLECALQTVL